MTIDAYKRQASRLADHLSSVHKVRLKSASALEAIAAVHNCRDWNTLCAEGTTSKEVRVTEQSGAASSPRFASQEDASAYLFTQHSFSDPQFCDALSSQIVCIADGYKEERRAIVDHLVKHQLSKGGTFVYLSHSDLNQHNRLSGAVQDSGQFLLSILPADPAHSHIFNPLALKEASSISETLLTLLPSAENNPGADFYRQSAHHALTVIIDAMLTAERDITFEALSRILWRPADSLPRLLESIKYTNAAASLSLFTDAYQKSTKEGRQIDEEKFKATLGGMAGRIAMFAQGHFGRVLNPEAGRGYQWDEVFAAKRSVFIDTVYDLNSGTLERLLMASLRGALREANKRLTHPPLIILDSPGSNDAANLLASSAVSQGSGFVSTHHHDLGRGIVARVSATGGFGRSAKVSLADVEKGVQTHAELHEFPGWSKDI